MFQGSHKHTIDSKGRIAIPAKYREVVAEEYDGQPLIITNYYDRCLVVYPYPEWAHIEERAKALPSSNPDVRQWIRFFVSPAVECPLDRQGRILIPPTFREYAALDRDVMILSIPTGFEIWDMTRYQEDKAQSAANIVEIAASLEKYGV
jgi:MraZ protein